MTEQKRKPKATGPRTEVFAMRLDPKLKYLAEIAARKQRRSLANFIEWAIERALRETEIELSHNRKSSVWDESARLWDLDEAERLVSLAFCAPDLMTYDEQILWKLVADTGHLWRGRHDCDGDWQWQLDGVTLIRERLHECWDDLKRVASGTAERDILPRTSKKPTSSGLDDDIEF